MIRQSHGPPHVCYKAPHGLGDIYQYCSWRLPMIDPPRILEYEGDVPTSSSNSAYYAVTLLLLCILLCLIHLVCLRMPRLIRRRFIVLHFPTSLWLSFLRFPSWSWGRRNRGEASTLSVLDETVGPPSIPQTARAGRSCCISPSPAAPRSAARAQAIAMLASTARMTKQDHGKYKTSRRHDNQWRKKPPSHQPKVIGIMHS